MTIAYTLTIILRSRRRAVARFLWCRNGRQWFFVKSRVADSPREISRARAALVIGVAIHNDGIVPREHIAFYLELVAHRAAARAREAAAEALWASR